MTEYDSSSESEQTQPEAGRDGELGDQRESIAFIGDSITALGDWESWFPDARTLNFGVGGSTTDDVLASVDRIIEARPDDIILLVGTNDLGTRQTVEHLVRNIQSICVTLRRELPGSRMLVQSVMPRAREFSPRIHDANIHLRQFSSTVNAQFLDLWPALSLEDGEINPAYSDDRLHLNDAGYEAWLGELRPAIGRLRDAPPMTTPIQIIPVDQYSRPTK